MNVIIEWLVMGNHMSFDLLTLVKGELKQSLAIFKLCTMFQLFIGGAEWFPARIGVMSNMW